jgi:hypothetical protein
VIRRPVAGLVDDATVDPANWTCAIGEIPRDELDRVKLAHDGQTAESMLRAVVEETWDELFGVSPEFTFSGFGSALPERERAVVEDREPDPVVMLAELAAQRDVTLGGIEHYPPTVAENAGLNAADFVEWIRRHVGRDGPPESWTINDFVALAVVKLGEAVMDLNQESPEVPLEEFMRHQGVRALLAAIAVLFDAVQRYGG